MMEKRNSRILAIIPIAFMLTGCTIIEPGSVGIKVSMGRLDRSLLKDALGVVRRFRGMLHRRFQLDRL